MLSRRRVLQGLAATGFIGSEALRGVALAAAPTDARFILIIQRGAADGLHALPPHGDPQYRVQRGRLMIPPPGTEGGALKLDGLFGLHPHLGPLHAMWAAGELVPIPAVCTRYRDRSHFDGQNALENGSGEPFGTSTGFLNRALLHMTAPGERRGLTVGLSAPLVLQGDAPVQTWAPSTLPPVDDDFLRRLALTYKDDPVLSEALGIARMPQPVMGLTDREKAKIQQGKELALAAKPVGQLMKAKDGPRIAVLEIGGWDTHRGQAFALGQRFTALARGIAALKDNLGAAWKDTVVMTLSEFGRTVAVNGSGGTDHGTGGTIFLAGGAVRGGRIIGEWPGLRPQDLFENRDLYPVNSAEAVLKAVLIQHLGLGEGIVSRDVLPGTDAIAMTEGLFRA